LQLRVLLFLLMLPACSQQALFDSELVEQPKIGQITQSARLLASLPAAKDKIAVSVYDFQDQTGQLKPNTQFAEYSRAVTQGGLAILNKALLNAGNGNWFTVVERGGLKDLLQERQIINMMRDQYALPDGNKLDRLPPLLYAGMLIEGGIVGFDSNIVTGGAGAHYLGIGGDAKYQRDIVTVDLRAISIATGEVVLSVTSEKTLYSTSLQGSIFKYVTFDHLLEAETGFTMNEPPQLAVRQAIETAVYSLIMEGARKNVWQFADASAGKTAVADYEHRLMEAGASSIPTGESPVAAPALTNTQLPAASAQVPPSATNPESAQTEKKSIIGKISGFLSSGDEAEPSSQPPAYPTFSPPQRARGYR
jgi:curli production assembly/transport component CsgG